MFFLEFVSKRIYVENGKEKFGRYVFSIFNFNVYSDVRKRGVRKHFFQI